jgi:hypothetical protein
MSSPLELELRKSALSHIDGLIQWAFLLNGAAAAGFLTFLGGAIDKQSNFKHWSAFSNVLLCFGAGLLLAVAARLLASLAINYLSQVRDPEPDANVEDLRIYLLLGDRAVVSGLLALALFIASCGSFVAGVFVARYAIFG